MTFRLSSASRRLKNLRGTPGALSLALAGSVRKGRFTGVRAPCLAAEDSHTVRRASCRKSARDVLWEPEAGDRLRRPGRGGGDITSLPDPLSARDGAKDGARGLAGGWGGARRLEDDRDSVFGGRIGGLPAGRRVLIEEPNPLPHPGDGPPIRVVRGQRAFHSKPYARRAIRFRESRPYSIVPAPPRRGFWLRRT
jgi:hypothetical protein